jgi:hypothetical protein
MRATGPAPSNHLRQNSPTGKISLNPSGKSGLSARPVSPDKRGVAHVTIRAVGCGGRGGGDTTSACCRGRRRRVVPIPRCWDQTSRAMREATVAGSPAHRGERAISRKPLRRECRCFGCPVDACVRESAFLLHARLAGAASIRHSLRPCVLEICQNVRTGGWIRTARCWN